MSSRHEVSRYRERSESHSVDRRSDHKSRDKDRRTKSKSPSSSKHRSTSREKKKDKKHKKSKKKKKKCSSSSSSSSSESEAELKLLQRLEAERQRLKEEKKKQKELMKANETPEEKRARRLREKQEKERKRRERMGWDTEYQGYTNQDNPFGDSALTNTFVWGKKLAKEGVKNVSHDELEALNRQKQLENKIELEKVKQRRLEREAERAAREAETLAAARAREAAQFSCWSRQEDAFHLQQARLRSQIRIRDGRAKPIDLLAWYVSAEECVGAGGGAGAGGGGGVGVDALEMHEPYTYLNGLHAPDLEDLLEDIKVYKELENNANLSYWEDVETIVLDELGKLRRLAGGGAGVGEDEGAGGAGGRAGVHRAVADDVTTVFKGKTAQQLEALQEQIEAKLLGQRAGVDVGYWESLLSQLRAHRARARLRDRHQENLRRKLQLLKQEQGVQPVRGGGEDVKEERSKSKSQSPQPAAEAATAPEPAADTHSSADNSDNEDDSEDICIALYRSGRYSPELLQPTALEPGTLLTEVEEDELRVSYLRSRLYVAAASAAHPPQPQPKGEEGATSTAGLERLAARSMGPNADEAGFSVEHALPEQPCLWADKYRPRKPRYFNRVHTGFEWNKYNQTHYDMDNPPPKIVQGYKFNIFYPDLIDPHSTPEFSLKPCADNPEFAVLRFHAGPPYEDIAFKIVNREWEYSYKRGFRIYAISDVIHGPTLAHKAEDEGIVCVEGIKETRAQQKTSTWYTCICGNFIGALGPFSPRSDKC